MHNKYKLVHSNSDSVYFKSWKELQPIRDSRHSNAFCNMQGITESVVVTIDKGRTGTLGNNKRLHMMGIYIIT